MLVIKLVVILSKTAFYLKWVIVSIMEIYVLLKII